MGEVTPTATNKMERAMHRKFGSSRLNGEWFRYFVDSDELLVKGKAGNVACLIVSSDRKGNTIFSRKFNFNTQEKGICIVGLDAEGNPYGD